MKTISIIIPCFNEGEMLPFLRESVVNIADRLAPRYNTEILLIDDGSKDSTWQQIQSFAAADTRVRGFSFSRNFGHQSALTCGYGEAEGDAVICMDADLQDPPDVILDMVEAWEAGADVVLAARKTREGETAFKKWTALLFYRILSWLSDVDLPRDVGDFRLMNRNAVDAFNRLGERRRYIRGMVAWIGFDVRTVSYDRKPRRAGTTKYSLTRMVAFAADGIISFSLAPLRLAFAFAIIGATPILAYLAYSFAMHIFFHGHFEPGWASTILTITIFGVLNLFCLGIVGEYIGRIYHEAKARPLYLLSDMTGRSRPRGGKLPDGLL